MPVLVADFITRFPAFDGVAPASIEAQLSDAWASLNQASFPNDTVHARAVMLMAAHHLTLSGLGRTTEATVVSQGFALDTVQSVSDGSVSVSLSAKGDTANGSTSYGRELDKLLASTVSFAVVGGWPPFWPNANADDGGGWFG